MGPDSVLAARSRDTCHPVVVRSSDHVLPCGYSLTKGTFVNHGPRGVRRRRNDYKPVLLHSGIIDERELIALEALEMMPTAVMKRGATGRDIPGKIQECGECAGIPIRRGLPKAARLAGVFRRCVVAKR